MQSVGQAWLVLQLTHNAFLLGLVSAFQFLPVLAFSLFGGVVADKLPKRNLLLGTQSAAMVQALVLFLLTATRVVQVWEVMLLAMCLGVINALDIPTRQSFISEMVAPEDLMNAISLNSAQFNASRVVGPGIAGILIALLGIPPLFLLNAASYLAVLAGLLLMDPGRLSAPVRAAGRERPLRQIREGVAFAWRTPAIRLALTMLFVVSTFGLNFNITLPLLADTIYGSGAKGFGAMSSLLGLGSLLAALVLAGSVKRPRVQLMVLSAACFGTFELALALTHMQLLAFGLLVIIGFAAISFSATANTLLQANSPAHIRGRVMSLFAMVFAGATPIGALVTGTVARAWGAPAGLLAGAVPCLLVAAFGWWATRAAPVGALSTASSAAVASSAPGGVQVAFPLAAEAQAGERGSSGEITAVGHHG